MNKEVLKKVYNVQRNLIVSGDIATGKTASVLFPLVDKMIEQKESLMILDSKEEYINKYHKKLKEKNYNIVVLNLKDLDKSEGWNPLEYAYELYKNGNSDKAMDYLEKIAKIMFFENSFTDPFWSLTASDFFTGIVLGLFEDAKETEINFNSVNAMFDGINEKNGVFDYLTSYFNLKKSSSQSYILASSTTLAPKPTKGSILSVAKQKLKTYVSREKLSMLMNKTTFSFDDIINKPTAIFFIARDESKVLNTLASMFIGQLFSILFDKQVFNKFNFVLDNFDIIEKVDELTDMLGAGLSKRIKFIVSTRSLEDLSFKYGNYITKLSNQIYVTNDILKIKINGSEETIENTYEEGEIIQNEVEYPELNTTVINVFDLKKYVDGIKNGENESNETNLTEFESDFSVDSIMQKIDAKMEKLNNSLNQENVNENK